MINFIVPEISRTGGMRIIFEYANRFCKLGHDVKLYSPVIPFYPYKGKIKRHFIKYQIKHARACLLRGMKPPQNSFEHSFDIQYVWAVNNSNVRNADATIATSWTSSYPVNGLNSSKGKKLYLIQDYEIWNASVEHVNRSYTFPMTRITVSGYLRDLIKQKFGSDSHVILNGIDFRKFNNENKHFNAPPRILFIDHPLDNKNTLSAIEAATLIHNKYPEVKFTCFRTGRYHEMPDFIEVVENPNDEKIAALYQNSDIFLFPSIHEGFGLPPAEAMACKCALVGTRAGAVPEFSENMKSAVLCNSHSTEDLVNGIEYLLNNSEDLKRISEEGEKSVRSKLDWNKSVNQFISLLK